MKAAKQLPKDALDGVKVADFSWVLAGPLITKCLADHGATVVRIESGKRPCVHRAVAPFKDGEKGLNRAGYFAYYNANKLSCQINIDHPRAEEVLKRLIMWADIVVENFSPGVMDRKGMGYEELRKIKSDIIMLRSSNQGQTGPFAKHAAFGVQLVGLLGFSQLIGWPEGSPLQTTMAWTDFVVPQFGVAALMAALEYRDRTGKGQLLDVSQFETSLHFLAPPILDYVVNQNESMRMGNRCPYAAPHGAYRCQGEERWCVIAVFTDNEWKDLCKVMGHPQWTTDGKFSTLLARKENENELDQLIEAWTINLSPEEVMSRLQAEGVAAGVVKNGRDIYEDPQLRQGNHLWPLEHKEMGMFTHMGQPFTMSETPARPRSPAPLLGEHTEYVCRELLGISEEEFSDLMSDGVFE
jgi:benzylsuccinate CoA-transferase BbsF subunit